MNNKEVSNERLENLGMILAYQMDRIENKLVMVLIQLFLWNVFVTFALLCKLFGWII